MSNGDYGFLKAFILLIQMSYFWLMNDDFLVKSPNAKYRLSFKNADAISGSINDEEFSLDIVETSTGFHIIRDGKGYNVDLLGINREKKKVELRINHMRYSFEVKDKYDELLEKLGMDGVGVGKVAEIKAPMPGLVLDVMVSAGDEVKSDQPLLILEAMKMENVIKSPADNTVKKVEIIKGDSVEKNQVLISFS